MTRPESGRPLYGELYASPGGQAPASVATTGAKKALWPWVVFQAAAGLAVGLAWWLLAPGGLNLLSGNPSLADGTRIEGWLPRDLVLAGLFLLAGSFVAVLLDGKPQDSLLPRRIVLVVIGGAAGALTAWLVGVQAGQWWGPPADTFEHPSMAFSLRSLAVLALWPGATAACTFALNLISLMRKPSGEH